MLDKLKVDSDKFYDESFYRFTSLEESQKFYPLIGELISVFNAIEHDLTEELIELINNNSENIGWIIVSEFNYASKVRVWTRIVGDLLTNPDYTFGDELKTEYKYLAKKLMDIGKDRNSIAHADWENMNKDLYVKTRTEINKNGIEHAHIRLNIEAFEDLIEDFADCDGRLLSFSDRISKLLSK